jgi:hypothetical protein
LRAKRISLSKIDMRILQLYEFRIRMRLSSG